MKKNYLIYLYFSIFVLLLSAGNSYLFAKPKGEINWKTRQNLVFRLGSEWYKIGLLERDLSFISDILSDLRDLELFPLTLTGFDENELLHFDKQIEKCEKNNISLLKKIDVLKTPLSDALSITKELVTGDPVESMFEVLEEGDLKRINEMIGIKHDIDRFWKDIDSLLIYVSDNAGMRRTQDSSRQHLDKEFFEILKANLGQTADGYFEKLNMLKQHMISKADTTQIREMYKIELFHLSALMKGKDFDAAIRKTDFLIPRYEKLVQIDELYIILAQLHLHSEDLTKVLDDLSRINDTKLHGDRIALYKFQTLYALKRYSEIISLSQNTDFSSHPESNRNLLLWITLESALNLDLPDFSATALLSALAKNQPYSIHAMHAFSRLLLEKGDSSNALSVLQSIKTHQVITPEDELARRRVDLSIAWISFQNGKYEDALTQFFQILKNETLYDYALFGILWCYIKTGQSDKAETALRKLINQSPESPLAAEGILILAERYLDKAWSSWKKSVYLFNEEERLATMFNKLESRFDGDTLSQQYSTYVIARDELKTLTQRIKLEPRESYSQIAAYYDQVEKVCNLISHHYKSGTFQEASFSQEREKILYFLDSILINIKNDGNNSSSKRKYSRSLGDRSAIKTVVDKSVVFSTISSLDKYRWERDYIDQQKTILSKQIQTVETALLKVKDSLLYNLFIKEKDSLNSTMNTLLKEEENKHEFYFAVLSNKLSTLIKTDLDFNDRAYFIYQLGELYYSQENRNYSKKFDTYELAYTDYEFKLKAFRNGAQIMLPVEPIAPVLTHDTSMNYFRSVIDLFQPSEYLHAAHYSLAWCYNDLGFLDSALSHFNRVATNFPSSPHAPQSWMYCGEYYFDKGKLDTAISCYHSVMKYPESEWFDEALYKQAWAQYRLSNPEKAISSFLALVDLGEGNVSGKSLLEKESMDYIAISFSETDPTGPKGLDRAIAFIKKLNDNEKGSRILQRLASVYSDQGRYDLALKTLETLLTINPDYVGSPQVDFKLLTLLERELPPREINQKKFDFYKKYSMNSLWTSNRKDSLLRVSTDSLAERMLYNSAIGFHQLALQKSESDFFKDALNAYREYIRSYPLFPSANECHYNLAEIQFSIGNYKEAAEEYMAVSKRYPDSKYKETAAWNAIVASQNYLKQESSAK
jgi:tetratricopeptide (TPR) repeat protein